MASLARTQLLRQFAAAPSKTAFARNSSILANAASRPAQQQLRSSAVRDALQGRTRIAAFHATGSKAILPPLPQVVEGDVNVPAGVPHSSPVHGSYHWTFERAVSVGIIPLTLAPFIGGSLNPLMDSLLCATLLIHSHIGFEAAITDYFPRKRLPTIRPMLDWLLRIATVLAGVGLYSFETNDIGLTAAIAKVWTA